MADADHSESLLSALALVAPGTPLRDGLDRVLQAGRGALVVVGDDPAVLAICTGGFALDVELTPQRLSELAKMDGAIVVSRDASRVVRANAHLMPRASVPTSETGTRHRTAERVARSFDVPVVSVSEAMGMVTVYRGVQRHTLHPTSRVVERATQAIAAVERFKKRYDLALALLSTLEVSDSVSVSDVVAVLQPGEMVVRFTGEVEGYLVELGGDGRLIRLQIEELGAGVEETLRLVMLDYVLAQDPVPATAGAGPPGPARSGGPGEARFAVAPPERAAPFERADGPAPGTRVAALDGSPRGEGGPRRAGEERDGAEPREQRAEEALAALHALSHEELLDRGAVASVLGLPASPGLLDHPIEARGYRLLHRLPRVSGAIIERIVERFVTLPRLMQASLSDLEKVGGVGEARARSVKDGLSRMVEASILERYE